MHISILFVELTFHGVKFFHVFVSHEIQVGERERGKKRKNFLHRREIRTLGEIDKKSTSNVVCLCLFYVMANAGSSHFELTRIF